MPSHLELIDLRNPPLGDLAGKAEAVGRILTGPERDLIPLLQAIQGAFGYLPGDVLLRLSRSAGIPLARVYGVATFYAGFHFEPRGRHVVRVCHGTACHVRGSPRITEELSRLLGIAPGETTRDGEFTLERVACVGCCSLAPVAVVGRRTYGRLDPRRAVGIVQQARGGPR